MHPECSVCDFEPVVDGRSGVAYNTMFKLAVGRKDIRTWYVESVKKPTG